MSNLALIISFGKMNLPVYIYLQLRRNFRFAKIIYIMAETQQVHIQWFNHGSQMILKEFAHPQELFLDDLCGHESLSHVVGKATVHFLPKEVDPKVNPDEYFCK